MSDKKIWKELFSEEDKIAAFDKIADVYYQGNFGTMLKSDFEVLLFSIYLDRILDRSGNEMNSYSDYTLSKQLGITESRVRSLKVKKDLRYHYEELDWKESFLRVIKNMRYENGYFKISIPDPNLYLELRNYIEVKGGYIEASLNQKLLTIPAEFFLNMVLDLYAGEEERKQVVSKINKYLREKKIDEIDLNKETLDHRFWKSGCETGLDILEIAAEALGLSPVSSVVKLVKYIVKEKKR